MKVLYFARFRQVVGRASDEIDISALATVGDLVRHLIATDPGCAAAFANLQTVKAALNRKHVGFDAPLAGAEEVAFFPPVTGG